MTVFTDKLDEIAADVRQELSSRDAVREKILPLCREVIRYCSQSIRAAHRRQFPQADDKLTTARDLLEKARFEIASFNSLSATGYYKDAEKEYAEASLTLLLLTDKSLLSPQQLGVDGPAYLNGMAEAAGELRRFILDDIRHGDLTRVERLLSVMDDIYSILVTMDFPDAISGGLRRNTDMVRVVLEKTRGDVTLIIQHKYLEGKINDLNRNISTQEKKGEY
ncbi:MAG: haloacid dehalogenase [Chloroflexi bacterium]|nr:haloacid dehalogenase [Chloroflexota bacterium]